MYIFDKYVKQHAFHIVSGTEIVYQVLIYLVKEIQDVKL